MRNLIRLGGIKKLLNGFVLCCCCCYCFVAVHMPDKIFSCVEYAV